MRKHHWAAVMQAGLLDSQVTGEQAHQQGQQP